MATRSNDGLGCGGTHALYTHALGKGREAGVLTPSQGQEMSPCARDRTKARTEISTKTEIHKMLPTREISTTKTLPLTQGSEKETCHLLRVPGGSQKKVSYKKL